MKKQVSVVEIVDRIENLIGDKFDGDKVEAGEYFGCTESMVSYVVNFKRNPTLGMLRAVGITEHTKRTVHSYYEES